MDEACANVLEDDSDDIKNFISLYLDTELSGSVC